MEFIYHIWQYLCEKCTQNQQQTSPSRSKIGTDSQNTKTSFTKITIFPPSDVTFSFNFCFIQSKSLPICIWYQAGSNVSSFEDF